MALPTDEEVKAYLKVETDVEDNLIRDINLSAQAWLQKYLGVPLTSTTRTFRGRYPRKGYRREPEEQLVIPVWPCNTSATITNVAEEEVDSDLYEIDGRTGGVNAVLGEAFGRWPYTIEVGVGFEFTENYDTDVEPILRQAILWAATDYYRRRNPGVEYEQSGGQVSITYTKDAIPASLRNLLESLRPKGRAW